LHSQQHQSFMSPVLKVVSNCCGGSWWCGDMAIMHNIENSGVGYSG
jgi:hypothetical protein